jgi:hypothetical protein
MNCGVNYIYRVPYTRTTKSGKSIRVKGGCIKSRSSTGKKGSVVDRQMISRRRASERRAEMLTGTADLICPQGMIKRAGYVRKSHKRLTRANNIVHIPEKIVSAVCIPSRGIGSSVRIPITNKNELGQFGYSDVLTLTQNQRKRILNKAINKLGYLPVIKKLNALSTLNRNTNPEVSYIFKTDQEWLSKKYRESGKVKSVIYKK